MNTDYNVVFMFAEAIAAGFASETAAKFAIWIKIEKLDSRSHDVRIARIMLQRTREVSGS